MRDNVLTSVDEGEVQRHSDLMHTWWDPAGGLKGLHHFNRLRVPFITDGLVSNNSKNSNLTPLSNKNILEVGCGGGLLTEELAKLGARVTGVDPSRVLIDLATEHSKVDERVAANKPTYYNTTIEEHSKQFPNYYDAVVASEVVEHVADVDLFLQSCVAALKPGGKIFITSPNRTRLGQFAVMVVGVFLNLVPKGLMRYDKFTKPEEISDILEKYNCKVDNVQGLIYYPFIERWQWVFFKSLWYALAATKQGF